MHRSRLSIAEMMVGVALVAANIVAVRPLFLSHGLHLVIDVAPFGIVLQIGLWEAIRRRGEGLAFWAGFLISGTYSLASLLLIHYASVPLPYLVVIFWGSYPSWTGDLIRKIPGAFAFFKGHRIAWLCFEGASTFIPHLLFALTGGVIMRRLTRRVLGRAPASSTA